MLKDHPDDKCEGAGARGGQCPNRWTHEAVFEEGKRKHGPMTPRRRRFCAKHVRALRPEMRGNYRKVR